MNGLRFSLKGLFAAVAIVAFACVALLNATVGWACAAFTITILVLLIAVLGAVYRKAEARAFYVGTSLFGWAYVLLIFGPVLDESAKRHSAFELLLDWLVPQVQSEIELPVKVQRRLPPGLDIPDGAPVIATERGFYGYRFPIVEHIRTVGHALFALLFATGGGLLARFFYGTQDRDSRPA